MSGKIKRVKIRGRGPGGLAGTLGAAVAFLLFLGAALAVLSGEITARAEDAGAKENEEQGRELVIGEEEPRGGTAAGGEKPAGETAAGGEELAGEAAAEGEEELAGSFVAEEILGQFDYEDMDKAMQSIFPKERMDFRGTVAAVISGDLEWSAKMLWEAALSQLTYAFSGSRENLIHILIIAVIAAVFHNFSAVFQNRQICEISFYILYLLLITLCLGSFQMVMEWVSGGVEKLTGFMTAFCPVYFLAVSIAKGSMTAVAFYHLVLFFILVTEMVIVYFLLPAIHIYIMVKVLDFLSSQEYLSKFAELIEVAVSWLLKTLVACVVGANVVQGMISPAIDTVKRSAVTRTAEAIPGVGDAIGGTAEVVLGTAVLVKNGIGTVGMIVCLVLCVVPLVQIGAIVLMYKLAAAVIQPVSDKRIVGCVECVGDGCRLLMRVVFTAGLLFLLTIVIVSYVTGSG